MLAPEMKSAFSSRRIEANGVSLNVIDVGEGEPVLLVHGFPDTHAVWRKQIPALVEAGYRVIAPDTRGCGESEMPDRLSGYKLPLLIDDLRVVLDACGVEKAAVIAHDWGAVIAWQFVLAHPERVNKYLAMSVGHPNAYARGGVMQKLKGWYVLMFQLRGFAEWFLKARDWAFFRWFTALPEEWPHWIKALERPGRLTAGINYYRANWIGLLLGVNFPKAQVPVVGLYSDGDIYLTESQMKASAQFCDAGFTYKRIEGAKHWMQIDSAKKVTPLLLEQLAAA